MHKTTEIPLSPLSNRFKPRKRFHLETFNRIPGANIRISHIVVVIVIHVNCVSSELNAFASITRKKRGKKKKEEKYIYERFLGLWCNGKPSNRVHRSTTYGCIAFDLLYWKRMASYSRVTTIFDLNHIA